AADAGRHEQGQPAARDALRDGLVQTVDARFQLQRPRSVRERVRQVAEAVDVQRGLVEHLEVRMLADERVEVTRQAEALGEHLPQPGRAEGPEYHPDLQGAEGPRHLRTVIEIVDSALALLVLAE